MISAGIHRLRTQDHFQSRGNLDLGGHRTIERRAEDIFVHGKTFHRPARDVTGFLNLSYVPPDITI